MTTFHLVQTNVPGETETYLWAKPPKLSETSFATVVFSETSETGVTSETGETSETGVTSETETSET